MKIDKTISFETQVKTVLDELGTLLITKNKKYGNSALEPVRIFSKATPIEQILVRLDDKLSRLKTQSIDEDEDVLQDLLGYLVLLKLAMVKPSAGAVVKPTPYCLLGKPLKLKELWAHALAGTEFEKLSPLIAKYHRKDPIFYSEFSQLDDDGNITIKRADVTVPFNIFEEI